MFGHQNIHCTGLFCLSLRVCQEALGNLAEFVKPPYLLQHSIGPCIVCRVTVFKKPTLGG